MPFQYKNISVKIYYDINKNIIISDLDKIDSKYLINIKQINYFSSEKYCMGKVGLYYSNHIIYLCDVSYDTLSHEVAHSISFNHDELFCKTFDEISNSSFKNIYGTWSVYCS
jgi:hypothetical protein